MKPSSSLQKLDKGIVKVSRWLSYVSAACLIFIMCLAFADAMSSKLFRSSIPRATELVTYINIPIVFLGLAIVQLKDMHTTVDLTYGHYPPVIKKLCCIVANLAAVGVCGYLARLGFLYAADMLSKGNLSGAIVGFKLWPFAGIMGVGWLTLALASLWTVVRIVFNLIPLPGSEEEQFMEATKNLPVDSDGEPEGGESK